jgi:hypothetical protein
MHYTPRQTKLFMRAIDRAQAQAQLQAAVTARMSQIDGDTFAAYVGSLKALEEASR